MTNTKFILNENFVKKALQAIAEEDLEILIDSKNIADDQLKKALLSAADKNIFNDTLGLTESTDQEKKEEKE